MKSKFLILGLLFLFSLTAVHAQQSPVKSRHQKIEKNTNRKDISKRKSYKVKNRKTAALNNKKIRAKQNKRFIKNRKAVKTRKKYRAKQMKLQKKYLRKTG